MRRLLAFAGAAGLVDAALSVTGLGATAASASSNTMYVSPHGNYQAHDRSCGSAKYSSIQSAIHGAPWHGNVVVCPGVYKTSVTIDRAVNLYGKPGAVIDATGKSYGIGVATSWVTVSGMTVENASLLNDSSPADGIVTAGFVKGQPKTANHVTISGNTVKNNKGSGIDLNSTSYSTAIKNLATGGPASSTTSSRATWPTTTASALRPRPMRRRAAALFWPTRPRRVASTTKRAQQPAYGFA